VAAAAVSLFTTRITTHYTARHYISPPSIHSFILSRICIAEEGSGDEAYIWISISISSTPTTIIHSFNFIHSLNGDAYSLIFLFTSGSKFFKAFYTYYSTQLYSLHTPSCLCYNFVHSHSFYPAHFGIFSFKTQTTQIGGRSESNCVAFAGPWLYTVIGISRRSLYCIYSMTHTLVRS
jgi:hypothetical protein